MHGADEQILRINPHLVVEVVGNRAAVGQGGETGPPPATDPAANGVVMQVGSAPAAGGGKPAGQHLHHRVELFAPQLPVGVRPAVGREQIVGLPLRGAGLGHDLLRQDVERLQRHLDPVQLPRLHRHQQGRAFHQFVAGQREQAPLGGPGDVVAGAADALQKRHDRLWRPELAHQIDHADVDPELQRCGGNDGAQLPALEPLLSVEALLLGQAAVVGRDLLLAEHGAQGVAHALRQAAGVDEDQGGAVVENQVGESLVEFLPHLVRHHRLKGRTGQLQRHLHLPPVPGIHDRARGRWMAGGAGDRPCCGARAAPRRSFARAGPRVDRGSRSGDPTEACAVCRSRARARTGARAGSRVDRGSGSGDPTEACAVCRTCARTEARAVCRSHARARTGTCVKRGSPAGAFARASATPGAGEEGRGGGQRLLGGGQANAGHRRRGEAVQPFQTERQVGAALGAEDGMDLVDDDGARGAQHGAAAGAGEQQVKRFRRGDQDVRRPPGHRRARRRRRVSGPQAGPNFRGRRRIGGQAAAELRQYPLQRRLQVAFDVVAQRLER